MENNNQDKRTCLITHLLFGTEVISLKCIVSLSLRELIGKLWQSIIANYLFLPTAFSLGQMGFYNIHHIIY
jgi:hypothetical protein